MHRNVLVLVILLAAASAHAGVPGHVAFTARLVDNGLPAQGAVQVKLDLFRAASGGTSVWTEAHAATATDGLVAIAMGDQAPFDATVLGGPLFLEVTVDSTVLSPRLEFGSVPFALQADSASKLGDLAATDLQRRIFGSCPDGSAIRTIDATGAVTCEVDDDSRNTFGLGLLENGGTVTIDPLVVQARVAATCPAGSSISAINGDGSVGCELDNDTTYTAGTGVAISPTNVVSADFAQTQRRVVGSCAAGSSVRTVNADGSVVCEIDTNTTYSASCASNEFLRSVSSTGSAVCDGLAVSQAFTLAANQSTTQVTLALGNHAFCGLTRVQATNSDDVECRLTVSGTAWTLVADGSSGIGSIVSCEARCL